MSSNSWHPFFSYYLRSLLIAALAFGLAHGGQTLIVSFIRNHSLGLDPTALITVLVVEILQSLVFIAIGVVMAYIPSRMLERLLRNAPPARRDVIAFITGVLLGILFLPLCAVVPYFYFHESDEPSYLVRCAEFALPMVIAGVLGSYFFCRLTFSRHLSHRH